MKNKKYLKTDVCHFYVNENNEEMVKLAVKGKMENGKGKIYLASTGEILNIEGNAIFPNRVYTDYKGENCLVEDRLPWLPKPDLSDGIKLATLYRKYNNYAFCKGEFTLEDLVKTEQIINRITSLQNLKKQKYEQSIDDLFKK